MAAPLKLGRRDKIIHVHHRPPPRFVNPFARVRTFSKFVCLSRQLHKSLGCDEALLVMQHDGRARLCAASCSCCHNCSPSVPCTPLHAHVACSPVHAHVLLATLRPQTTTPKCGPPCCVHCWHKVIQTRPAMCCLSRLLLPPGPVTAY